MPIANINAQFRCVATTGNAFQEAAVCDDGQSLEDPHARQLDAAANSNFFRDAEFTADGTAIVTHNRDHCLRTYVLPHDLLDHDTDLPRTLTAHVTITSPTAVRSFATYPRFDLQNPSTTLVLSSSKDLPITLHNALAPGVVHAKYPLVDPWTEEFGCPTSLLWGQGGSHFLAGSKKQLSVFDASRDNAEPFLVHRTSRKKLVGHAGPRFNGYVTALAASSNGILAAGTTGRQVTLLEQEGRGEFVTSFDLANTSQPISTHRGTGITQLAWSPCGKYLLIAERQSDCIQVYDMRNMFTRLAYLAGRKADTTQRLGMNVVPTAAGCEVWAGGTDGMVNMWRDPGSLEGEQEPNAQFEGHNDAVSATVWHPGGAVLASCSGQRRQVNSILDDTKSIEDIDSEKRLDSTAESTLRIWTWSDSDAG